MKHEDLQRFLARGQGAWHAGPLLSDQELDTALAVGNAALHEREARHVDAWRKFAVQIELRARTLRASILSDETSGAELRALVDALETAAVNMRAALEPKPPALTAAQHAAFPNGRWNKGGAK